MATKKNKGAAAVAAPTKIPKSLHPGDVLVCNKGERLQFRRYDPDGDAWTSLTSDRHSCWRPNGRNLSDPEGRWIVDVVVRMKAESAKPEPTATAEADPHGTDAHVPGAKLDAGKIEAGLLLDFGLALGAVAEVATFGARKYTRGGWQHVPEGHRRYTDAMLRHLLKEKREPTDADSKLRHSAHAAWNALARLELELKEASRA